MLNPVIEWKGLKGKDRFREQSWVAGGGVIKKTNNSKSSWRHILNTSVLKILEHL